MLLPVSLSAIVGNVPKLGPNPHLVDGEVLGHLVREDVQLVDNVCKEHISFNNKINIYLNHRKHTNNSKSSLIWTSF